MENSPSNYPSHTTKKNFPGKNLLFFLIAFLLAIASFLGGIKRGIKISKNQNETPLVNDLSSPTSILIQEKLPTTDFNEWESASFGEFSYDYPTKWHVTEIWQNYYSDNRVTLAIDPKPISTAPRGGPLATFEITFLLGENPQEILLKEKNNFNQTNYSEITEEIIPVDLGKIYYYKGKIAGEMAQGEPVEKYYYFLNENKAVIASMELQNDSQLSAMLKHIVFSLKKISP